MPVKPRKAANYSAKSVASEQKKLCCIAATPTSQIIQAAIQEFVRTVFAEFA
jgi:hypothetical protein